jgi:hypothetical protein
MGCKFAVRVDSVGVVIGTENQDRDKRGNERKQEGKSEEASERRSQEKTGE